MARAAITGFLEDRSVEPGRLASVRLLVSELVSNAVVHSDAPPSREIMLAVRLRADAELRVEVTDGGAGSPPVLRDPGPSGGYGLYLVAEEAERWGVERGAGTCVWFEMALGTSDVDRANSESPV
jgi:anti-sigma regulatory factor (Ser/Thr protein kinase)